MDSAHEYTETGKPDSGEGTTEEITQQAKQDAAELADAAKHRAEDAVEGQKQAGATQLSALAGAVHKAADELGKEVPQAAGVIHRGADRLESASRTLSDRSITDLAKMAENAAHEKPGTFIAGSFAAGFVISRFLRSSRTQAGSRP